MYVCDAFAAMGNLCLVMTGTVLIERSFKVHKLYFGRDRMSTTHDNESMAVPWLCRAVCCPHISSMLWSSQTILPTYQVTTI